MENVLERIIVQDTDAMRFPQDTQAEKAVLGTVLINSELLPELRVILKDGPKEFYYDRHKLIWKAILDVADSGRSLDFLLLANQLSNNGKLEDIGGQAYLTGLLAGTFTTLNASAYAEIIHQTYIRRQMITAANEIANLAVDDALSQEDLLAKATGAVSTVAQKGVKSTTISLMDSVSNLVKTLEKNALMPYLPGIPTGLIDFDKALGGGGQNSDLNLIGGRPGDGKTSLLMQIARHAAKYKRPLSATEVETVKKRVVVFSLEMKDEQLTARMISSLTGIDYQTLRTGRIPTDKLDEYYQAIETLSELDLVLDCTPRATPTYIRNRLEIINAEAHVDMVVLDSLNLMTAEDKRLRSEQATDENATQLKAMARDFDIPFWVAHQMNRAIEHRDKNATPTLADLREGGEQPSDGVIFVHHLEDSSSLVIAKQRNGPTMSVPVVFIKKYTKFGSIAKY